MKTVRVLATIAWLVLCSGAGGAVEPARDMHGVADVFAAPGVALAWGVLRGNGDAATIVIRIAVDTQQYGFVAADGIDPFTQNRNHLLPVTRTAGSVDVRVPRTHFADFPRTELAFFRTEAAIKANAPDLVVFYLGVPDTTPEIAGEGKLDAYLAARIVEVRAKPGGKAP